MSGGSHSSNLELLDQEASMQNIDRFIEALEMKAKESEMSKCKKMFSEEPSSSALQVYQLPDPEEPSSSALQRTDRRYKKDAWQDIAPWFGFSLTHSQPRSEGWLVDDFKKFSLEGHPDAHVDPRMVDYHPDWHMWVSFEIGDRLDHRSNDKFSGGKFLEGWQAIVRIVRADFLARQAIARHEHEPLLLEAHNAFINIRAKWDNEKEKLVREREALKEELNKAKEMAIEAKEMVAEAE
ncbi:hypothetical protein R1flu_019348 [Riccia fluitans]|uniref:Uncharacterized protein n=1 Tax=Riccia fluitans TaxID=41844 RepID=A0ABD1ZIQ8_9MARC